MMTPRIGPARHAVMREAVAILATAKAEMDMPDRAIIGRNAARPTAQMRVDAGGIADHIDGATAGVQRQAPRARDAGMPHARDDARTARRCNLARLGGEWRVNAGE